MSITTAALNALCRNQRLDVVLVIRYNRFTERVLPSIETQRLELMITDSKVNALEIGVFPENNRDAIDEALAG